MIVVDDYHGLIEVFFLVIHVIFIILCKGHVKVYDVLIVGSVMNGLLWSIDFGHVM